MLAVVSWWLIMEVMGLLALPLSLRVFRHLPDRGYALAKPLGLLLSGYLLWIGASFGFLSNSQTGILFCMVLVGLASFVFWQRDRGSLRSYFSQNQRVIAASELLFALAFVGWAVVRAYNPDIAATEKPMEIAFLNTILRSERFPAHDPWLSGFAISYYYFGYLLVAVLTKLSGVAASIGFNLAISLLFALTATGSFSLVYNLVATDMGQRARQGISCIAWALLGPLFVVLIGNLEGLFEMLHTRGLGSPRFWQWLDVEGLISAPVNGRWVPTDMWWWWRASRVVNDRDLRGIHMEVIDEFPQFSFLLGDMHPHVLALPFVVLALALALNLLLGARHWTTERLAEDASSTEGDGVARWPLLRRGPRLLSLLWQEHGFDILVLAVCLGALGFLNTWDLPIHLVVVVAAFLVGQRVQQQSQWVVSTISFGLSVAVPAILLYLPFYLGFQSQAGGVLPLFFNTTRVHQYLMMFGLFVFVLGSFVVLQLRAVFLSLPSEERRGFWIDLLSPLPWLVLGLPLLMLLVVLLIVVTPTGKQFLEGVLADEQVRQALGGLGIPGLIRHSVVMRLANPWTLLLVGLLIASLWYLMQRSWRGRLETHDAAQWAPLFVQLISGVALLLTLVVEFVYLRDLFMTRMNTVFKFYYQAWVMLAISAAFGSYYLLARQRPSSHRVGALGRYAWLAAFVLLVLTGMIYPLLAIPNKAASFKGKPTLDGMAYLEDARPDDYAAIRWLQEQVPGIAFIVEATGGSYSDAAFVSAFTGLPTVLGWDFHEYQWRGNTLESGKRQPDIAQIYQSADSGQVLALLDKYSIDYVYVGPTEIRKYELAPQVVARLGRFLEEVYEAGGVRIYRRGPSAW